MATGMTRPRIDYVRKRAIEAQLERKRMLALWKHQQLAKKLAFGAPKNMRKGERAVDSHWFIPGGGVETQRHKH
jgi:hypothetical protein